VKEWKKRDPLERLRLYMNKRGFWSEGYQRELDERARGIIDAAVRTAESAAPPQRRDIFVTVFDQRTPRQTRDMEEVKDAGV